MSCLLVIPARYASSRFPGKPLAELNGRPLIGHVVERALAAQVGPVVVATDHRGIAEAGRAAGAHVIMTASELRSGTDRVAAACTEWTHSRLGPADVVINVQGDEPCIEIGAIHALLRPFARAEVEMSTVAAPLDPDAAASPHAVKVVVDAAGRALYFSRASIPWCESPQPGVLLRHLGLYAYRRRTLNRLAALPVAPLEQREKLEQLRALHHGIAIYVARVARAWGGVDVPEDLAALKRQQTQEAKE